MSRFIEFVKKHPVLSGLLFFFFVIIIYVLTKGSGGSGQAAAAPGQTAADVAEFQVNAALQAKQLDTAAQLQVAQLQAATAITTQANDLAARLQAAELETSANKDVAIATLTEQQNVAVINANASTAQAMAEQAAAEAKAEAESNATLAQIEAVREIELAKYNNQGQLIADIANPNVIHSGRSSGGIAEIVSALLGTGASTVTRTENVGGGGFGVSTPFGGFSFGGGA